MIKKRLSVFGMLKKCEEMVLYYSIKQNYFNEYHKYINKLNTLALGCDKGLFKRLVLNYSLTKLGPLTDLTERVAVGLFVRIQFVPIP